MKNNSKKYHLSCKLVKFSDILFFYILCYSILSLVRHLPPMLLCLYLFHLFLHRYFLILKILQTLHPIRPQLLPLQRHVVYYWLREREEGKKENKNINLVIFSTVIMRIKIFDDI